jgi:hypothetical protein
VLQVSHNPLTAKPRWAPYSVKEFAEFLVERWPGLQRRARELNSLKLMPKHKVVTDPQLGQGILFPEMTWEDLFPGRFSPGHLHRQFGCGALGCVLPTFDPEIVFKVTSDVKEAELIGKLLELYDQGKQDRLQGIVQYLGVYFMGFLDSNPMYAVWREEAYAVGGEAMYKKLGPGAVNVFGLLDRSYVQRAMYAHGIESVVSGLDDMQEMIETSNGKYDILEPLFETLYFLADEHGITIGDLHPGNFGLVNGGSTFRSADWNPKNIVITDPGRADGIESSGETPKL